MYQSKNHSKYSLKVHLVFVVKYRKKLINKDIDFFLKTKIKQIEERSDFKVELMETDKDHIHLLINYDPKSVFFKLLEDLNKKQPLNFGKSMSLISRNISGKNTHFGQMDILRVVLEKVQVIVLSKSTLKTEDRSHSCAQLKTDHFSGSEKYKSIII